MQICDDAITLTQAGKLYGCSLDNIYYLLKRGYLQSWRAFGKRLCSRRDILRLKEEIIPRGMSRSH